MTYYAGNKYQDEIRVVALVEDSSVSTTLIDDAELSFYAKANTNYEIDILCRTTALSDIPDMRYEFTKLTSAYWLAGGHYRDQDTTVNKVGNLTVNTQQNLTAVSVSHGGSTDEMWTMIHCTLTVGSNAGMFYYKWGQRVTSAEFALTRLAGSHMIVRKVGNN